MKFVLPNSAFIGNINSFVKKIEPGDEKVFNVSGNKKWISVHPAVICAVASAGLSVKEEKRTIEPLEAKSAHYFERIGLFKMLGIKSDIRINKHEATGRFIPLMRISNSQHLEKFIKNINPLLHLKPKQAEPIRYVISELVRNVFDHAHSPVDAIVCAQYYKDKNIIRIGVADRGIGIKESIGKSYAVEDDEEAILKALTPGITGTTRRIGGTDWNVGAGLFFVKSIAKVNKSYFFIYSGTCLYKLLKEKESKAVKLFANPLKDRFSSTKNNPFWKGTVIGIDFSLDNNEDFGELLRTLRVVFKEEIKERKKSIFRRPRFE